MIEYKVYKKELNLDIADGFFENWPQFPDKKMHEKILSSSYKAVVAIDQNKIIGFVTIISDGVLSAYIPLLEVLPSYRKKGIGKKLIEHALNELKNFYMVDTSCDDDLVDFYKQFSMKRANALILRNYKT